MSKDLSDLNNAISPAAARWLMEVGMRDANLQVQRNGIVLPPFVLPALQALADVADRALPRMSADGHCLGRVVPASEGMWGTTVEVAARVGRTDRHIRRLAAAGQVRSRRVGSQYQVDEESVRSVLRKKAA